MSLTTILLAAAYVAIALVAHFLLIGFLPLFYGWQAIRRREPLAPYAMVAAAIPLVLMFALYRH
jgi:glucan phosphoethanolaminetransferase (alkaline phosphatase superfamily)